MATSNPGAGNSYYDANIKYLKDENGELFSPVISSQSIFFTNSSVVDSGITLNDFVKNYIHYNEASQTSSGYMSAEDKTKLDGITESADSVSFTRSLTSGTKVGTITINGTGIDLYAPAQASAGAITTQVKSYTSGEISVYDTNNGSVSFTATGPGSGWYPTCATVPHATGTLTLGSGIFTHGITMTSAGNNTCSGTIYASGNSGNASTNRGTCTYYITWAKIG